MNVSVFNKHQVKIFGLYYNAITNKFNTVILGRVEHSQMGTADTKIVPDKERVDGNVNTLSRIATQYGAILVSAPILTEGDRTLFCRFIVKKRCLE